MTPHHMVVGRTKRAFVTPRTFALYPPMSGALSEGLTTMADLLKK